MRILSETGFKGFSIARTKGRGLYKSPPVILSPESSQSDGTFDTAPNNDDGTFDTAPKLYWVQKAMLEFKVLTFVCGNAVFGLAADFHPL